MEEKNCSICFEEYTDKNYCVLSCGHKFHLSCIIKTINQEEKYSEKCPLCRKNLIEPDYIVDINVDENLIFYTLHKNNFHNIKFIEVIMLIDKYSDDICLFYRPISGYFKYKNKTEETRYSHVDDDFLESRVNVDFSFNVYKKKYFNYDNDTEEASIKVSYYFMLNIQKKNDKYKVIQDSITFLGDDTEIDRRDFTDNIPCLGFDLDIFEEDN